MGIESMVSIREYNPETDEGFIYKTMGYGLMKTWEYKVVPHQTFWYFVRLLVSKFLTNYKCLIATPNDDPTQIVGFLMFGLVDNIYTLVWVHTAFNFRKMGIAKLLMQTSGKDRETLGCYLYRNRLSEMFTGKYNLVHNPFIVDLDLMNNCLLKEEENSNDSED